MNPTLDAARRRPLAVAGGDRRRTRARLGRGADGRDAGNAFGGPGYERDRDTLAAMWDRKDKIPFVTRRGGEVYNFWVDAEHKRGLWRRAPWPAYRDGEPDWEILLDLDALAQAEGEDWVWAGATMRPGERDRALLALSRGGGDATVLREYDIAARRFVEGGFVAPEAKQSADWVDADTLLVCSATGRRHPLGLCAHRAAVAARRAVRSRRDRVRRRGGGYFRVRRARPLGRAAALAVRPAHQLLRLRALARRRRGAAPDRSAGGRGQGHPRRLASRQAAHALDDRRRNISPQAPCSPRRWRTRSGFSLLFAPGERTALEDYAWIGGQLVLSLFEDLAPAFDVLTPDGGAWSRRRLAGVPPVGFAHLARLDAYSRRVQWRGAAARAGPDHAQRR